MKIDDEWSLSNNWLVTVFFTKIQNYTFFAREMNKVKSGKCHQITSLVLARGSKKNDFCLKRVWV